MLNPTNYMVKYIRHCLQTKNPCILFLKLRKNVDIYLIDRYLELNRSNNFFKKLLKNTEVFFLTEIFYFTVLIHRNKYSITHAKGNLA